MHHDVDVSLLTEVTRTKSNNDVNIFFLTVATVPRQNTIAPK